MQKSRGDESSSFRNLMPLDQFSRFIIDDSFLSQEGSTYPELILFFGDEDLLLESVLYLRGKKFAFHIQMKDIDAFLSRRLRLLQYFILIKVHSCFDARKYLFFEIIRRTINGL